MAVVKGHTHHSELLAGHQAQQPLAAGHDGCIRGLEGALRAVVLSLWCMLLSSRALGSGRGLLRWGRHL